MSTNADADNQSVAQLENRLDELEQRIDALEDVHQTNIEGVHNRISSLASKVSADEEMDRIQEAGHDE